MFRPLSFLRGLRELDPPLSLLERAVATELALRANDEGLCWPSPTRIAADIGASRARVRRARLSLETRGLVRKVGTMKRTPVLELRTPTVSSTPQVGHKDPPPQRPGPQGPITSGSQGPPEEAQSELPKTHSPNPLPLEGAELEQFKRRHRLKTARSSELAATLRLVGKVLDGMHEHSVNGERAALLEAASSSSTASHERVVGAVHSQLEHLAKTGHLCSRKLRWISAAILEWNPPSSPPTSGRAVLVGPHGDEFEQRARAAEEEGDHVMAQAWREAAAHA